MTPRFRLIVCTDRQNRIGFNGGLLYTCALDMKRFTSLTTDVEDTTKQNAVIMGYNTWASLPSKFRPLPNRINIVLSRTTERVTEVRKAGGFPFTNVQTMLEFVKTLTTERNYIIGGEHLYTNPILKPLVEVVHWTVIDEDRCIYSDGYTCTRLDVKKHFPSSQFSLVEKWSPLASATHLPTGVSNQVQLIFSTMVRRPEALPSSQTNAATVPIASFDIDHKPTAEEQYLTLLKEVLKAKSRTTRNSTTRSVFGTQIVVDLRKGTVPLLTTKKMAWKTCLRELLWFVRGGTDNADLQSNNVHIWDANASREFLDSRGLTDRKEGDLGPIYGFQWRHSGAEYVSSDTDYANQGVDQLEKAKELIRADPNSRRNLFTAWNPRDLDKMALPPCHVLGQWYVQEAEDDGPAHLWLQVYQRSGDLFLGIPFNLFSYSALVHMMAHLTGLRPGGYVHLLGDAHIYEGHVEAVEMQLQRRPKAEPSFGVVPNCMVATWEGFTLDSFLLEKYEHEPAIKAQMVA